MGWTALTIVDRPPPSPAAAGPRCGGGHGPCTARPGARRSPMQRRAGHAALVGDDAGRLRLPSHPLRRPRFKRRIILFPRQPTSRRGVDCRPFPFSGCPQFQRNSTPPPAGANRKTGSPCRSHPSSDARPRSWGAGPVVDFVLVQATADGRRRPRLQSGSPAAVPAAAGPARAANGALSSSASGPPQGFQGLSESLGPLWSTVGATSRQPYSAIVCIVLLSDGLDDEPFDRLLPAASIYRPVLGDQ